jgi:hypothetical protein
LVHRHKSCADLPRIIRVKENTPELAYCSFYGKTDTGRPTAL